MRLTLEEQAILEGVEGPGRALALKVVIEAGRLLGASNLIPITSSHIDDCIYYGDAGVHFVERLVELGAKATVPATLNVGALDLLHPELVQSVGYPASPGHRLYFNVVFGRGQGASDLRFLPSWFSFPITFIRITALPFLRLVAMR